MVNARAGVEGIAHDVVGAADSRPGEVLAGNVVGQRPLSEYIAGDAEHRFCGLAVGVVFELPIFILALVSLGGSPAAEQERQCAQLASEHGARFLYESSSVPLEWMQQNESQRHRDICCEPRRRRP